MRISTSQMHETAAAAITQRQADLFKTQEQLTSGKRINRPSDDPVGSAQAALAHGALADTDRWNASQGVAKGKISLAEMTFGSMMGVVQDIRESLVAGGNGSYSVEERAILAQDLQHRLDELVAQANSDDGAGGFLFAGNRDRSKPFALSGTVVSYSGDEGVRKLEVGPGMQLAITQNGADAFMRVRDGNGVFSTRGNIANTGTSLISVGSVTNASLVTGHDYQILFNAGGTSYDIIDATTAATLSAGNVFSAGAAISFDGMQVEISGTPLAGDSFMVKASRQTSLFDAVARGIAMLRDTSTGDSGRSWRTNELAGTLQDIDQGLEHLSLKRADAGSGLQQLDDLSFLVSGRAIENSSQISAVEDLDYAKATIQFSQQNTALQAALAAYSKTSKQNLFDYL